MTPNNARTFESFSNIEPASCKSANIETIKRRGPNNPDDPSNKFLKIFNTGSISIQKHEMGIW